MFPPASTRRARLPLLLSCVMLVLLSGCKGCNNNLSSAYPSSVPDGTVILVRDGQGVGAFVLHNQWPATGESVDFEWYYRTNHNGSFSTNDPAVQHGRVTQASNYVSFATFRVMWSGSTQGRGWVYYPRHQHGGPGKGWSMCVVGEINVADLRADDARWQFRDKPPLSWEQEKHWFRESFLK